MLTNSLTLAKDNGYTRHVPVGLVSAGSSTPLVCPVSATARLCDRK